MYICQNGEAAECSAAVGLAATEPRATDNSPYLIRIGVLLRARTVGDEMTGQPHPAEDSTPSRPIHLHVRYLALVFVGGVLGTAAREGMGLAIPSLGDLPLAILTVNLLGAFVLGLLLESLARRGPDHGGRRIVRLLLGTGVMGGFTTYSALAADTALLFGAGRAGSGVLYGVGSVLLGAVATWGGIWLGSRRRSEEAG